MTNLQAMTGRGAFGPNASASDGGRRLARRALGAALALVVSCATGAAPPKEIPLPAQCRVPDETAFIDASLPRFARRLKSPQPLTIVVVGSGSAAGSGTTTPEAAFPQRLAARLENAYPRSKPQLVVLAKTGQTAPAMYARLAREVLPLRPALVIWQTGSADAGRGVPVMEFGASLERGIAELQAQGSDVLLMDAQYSPRASLLINTDDYREAVRWSARHFDLPLFKRYDTMQYWWSNEIFDLDVQDKVSQLATADRIHDCTSALLFRLIQRGVADARP